MDEALRHKIDTLPTEPGVYLMKDRAGAIIYVGKAVNLRSRVRSYFTRGGDERAFVALLDELLGDLEVIVVRTEKEALLLESELIKKHQPRFNILLRDDKSFICLRLDERSAFPRLEVVRAADVYRKSGKRGLFGQD
ncbi:MAG TPA: excinuclease ABC subunit C, partial [Myxococcales bacterium]|nr:excinuclease ABC subunit C [Myxococcales bacterium]